MFIDIDRCLLHMEIICQTAEYDVEKEAVKSNEKE